MPPVADMSVVDPERRPRYDLAHMANIFQSWVACAADAAGVLPSYADVVATSVADGDNKTHMEYVHDELVYESMVQRLAIVRARPGRHTKRVVQIHLSNDGFCYRDASLLGCVAGPPIPLHKRPGWRALDQKESRALFNVGRYAARWFGVSGRRLHRKIFYNDVHNRVDIRLSLLDVPASPDVVEFAVSFEPGFPVVDFTVESFTDDYDSPE